MCQLNLYMVSKNISTKEVVSIFNKNGWYISKESYYKINELEEKYEFYSEGYCDCKSIISTLKDETVSTFDEYKIKKKNADVEKLSRMRKIKGMKDYKVRVKELENKRDKLFKIIENFFMEIEDYESKEGDKIRNLNLSDEENKIYRERLHVKLDDMFKRVEETKEFQDASGNYHNFINQNRDLNDSIYYDIDEHEKIINEYDFSDFYDEYNSLKDTYSEILEYSEEVCIYPFWQDGKTIEIKNRRQVKFSNLDINDLIFLPYRTMLTINR